MQYEIKFSDIRNNILTEKGVLDAAESSYENSQLSNIPKTFLKERTIEFVRTANGYHC